LKDTSIGLFVIEGRSQISRFTKECGENPFMASETTFLYFAGIHGCVFLFLCPASETTFLYFAGIHGSIFLCLCPNKNFGHISFIYVLYCAISTSTVTGIISLRIERPVSTCCDFKSDFHFFVASLSKKIGL
jgi:hypothetical protein